MTDVAVAGRRIYAVFAANRFERSSVSESSWRQVALPVRLRFLVSLAARGRNVWILGSSTHVLAGDAVLRSTDRGTTFERRRGPCVPELGGTLVPAGHGVVWAVCPTGMMAGLWLSRNGGRSFPTIRSFHGPGWVSRPPLTNGAQIFPLSTRAALLYAGGQGQLFQTSDLGVRWTRSMTARLDQLLWLGFATSRVGAALVTTRSRPNRALLWRTTDGGASWHVVPLR